MDTGRLSAGLSDTVMLVSSQGFDGSFDEHANRLPLDLLIDPGQIYSFLADFVHN
jgi:hypothetical protein